MNKFFSKLGILEYCFVGFLRNAYLRHSSALPPP